MTPQEWDALLKQTLADAALSRKERQALDAALAGLGPDDAQRGLLRSRAFAVALSLTRHNALRPEAVWELKAQALKKTGLLTLHRGQDRFDALGGLDQLKEFCRRALRPGRPVRPRGVLLLARPATSSPTPRVGGGRIWRRSAAPGWGHSVGGPRR